MKFFISTLRDSAVSLGLCLLAGVVSPWARCKGLWAKEFIKELIGSSFLECMASREVPSSIFPLGQKSQSTRLYNFASMYNLNFK